MAAWQSGTPAIWIYHDSRTRELAETMALPHMSHLEFLATSSIAEMKDKVVFDFNQYAKIRNELFQKYSSILESNSIKHNLS
jgi:hypothetical protein